MAFLNEKKTKQTPAPLGSCNNSSPYAALNSVTTAQICGKAISLKDVFNNVLAETPPKLRSQKDPNTAAQFGAAHEGQIWAKPAGLERFSSPKLLHWMRGIIFPAGDVPLTHLKLEKWEKNSWWLEKIDQGWRVHKEMYWWACYQVLRITIPENYRLSFIRISYKIWLVSLCCCFFHPKLF